MTWYFVGALGGTRTPNLLIRRDLRAEMRPGRTRRDLPKVHSAVRSDEQCYAPSCGQIPASD